MMTNRAKRYWTGGGFFLVLIASTASSPFWVSSSAFATGVSSATDTNVHSTENHLNARVATEIISAVGDDGFFPGDPADTPYRSPNMTGALQASGLGPPFVDLDVPVSNSGLGYTHTLEVPNGFLISEATLFVRIYPGHGGNFLALDRNVNEGQGWASGFGPRAVLSDVVSGPVEAGVLTDVLLDLSAVLMRPNENGDPAFENLIPELYDGEFNVGVAGDTGVDYSVLTVTVLPDCNGNGIDDAEDIAGGFSNDCDLNGIPDECDPDCNADGVPDACDTINPGGILNVPGDFATIQDAIDIACNGAEILVAPGTYNEVINFLGKAITLRSSDGPDVTVIDGTGLNDSVVKCVSSEGPATVLDGFTITGGSTGSPSPFGLAGGGMMNQGSSPTIRNCAFEFNAAPQSGGAMANFLGSSPLIVGSLFRGNATGDSGGAIASDAGTPTLVNCRFENNTAGDFGGGVYYQSIPGTVSIVNSVFIHNVAGAGGAIGARSADVQVTNCSIASNIAFGGGCCEAAQAQGGGTFDRGPSTWSISNSVLWDNADGSGVGSAAQIFVTSGSADVNHSCVQGGFAGTGNIAADPLFVEFSNDDLRLLAESPGIDAGDNGSLSLDFADLDGDGDTLEPLPLDLDGLPRAVCDVDMGAYEFQTILVPQSSNPPNCAIDARQPHDSLNPAVRFGWADITFDFGCAITQPLPGAFSVAVDQGTPPSIIDVIALENTLTLVLDEPIPAGQWTCFTHDASGAQTCLGYLPADVNGDGVSSPSDILAVIDSLNGVVPRPEYATDVDRSGASGPADILRVIDLLNGAAAFEPRLDATLSDCPSGE